MEYRKANVAPMPGLASYPPALASSTSGAIAADADAGDDVTNLPALPPVATTDGIGEHRQVQDV